MKVTTKQIRNLIKSARDAGANPGRIASLEAILDERHASRSEMRSANGLEPNPYTVEKTDEQGKKVIYYSTVPLSDEDMAYLEKL